MIDQGLMGYHTRALATHAEALERHTRALNANTEAMREQAASARLLAEALEGFNTLMRPTQYRPSVAELIANAGSDMVRAVTQYASFVEEERQRSLRAARATAQPIVEVDKTSQ